MQNCLNKLSFFKFLIILNLLISFNCKFLNGMARARSIAIEPEFSQFHYMPSTGAANNSFNFEPNFNSFRQNETQERECIICDESIIQDMFHSFSCGHVYCIYCLGRLLTNAINDHEPFNLRCPGCINGANGRRLFTDAELNNMRFALAEVQRIFAMRREILNQSNQNPSQNNALRQELAHLSPQEQARFRQRIKECPRCYTNIEKIDGCDHMTCRRCQHEFCWICLANYRPFHDVFACARRELQRANQSVQTQSSSNISSPARAQYRQQRPAEVYRPRADDFNDHYFFNAQEEVTNRGAFNNNAFQNRSSNNSSRLNPQNLKEITQAILAVTSLAIIIIPGEKINDMYKACVNAKNRLKNKSSQLVSKISTVLGFRKKIEKSEKPSEEPVQPEAN